MHPNPSVFSCTGADANTTREEDQKSTAEDLRIKRRQLRIIINKLINRADIHATTSDANRAAGDMDKCQTAADNSPTEPGKTAGEQKMSKTDINKFTGDME